MPNSSNLDIVLLSESQAQKYLTMNTAIQALEDAFTDVSSAFAIDSGDSITLTGAQLRADFLLMFTNGGINAAGTVNLPASIERGLFCVYNNTGQTLTIQKTSGQSITAPTIATSTYGLFYYDGSNVQKICNFGTAGGAATFLALSDTPANYTSAGKKMVRVNSGATDLEFVARTFDISGQVSGTPTVSVKVFERVTSTRTFDLPASLTDSRGYFATAPSGGSVDFDILKNAVSIGTMSFADGANTATFTFSGAVSFAAGDRLTLTAPGNLRTAADLSFSLLATLTD